MSYNSILLASALLIFPLLKRENQRKAKGKTPTDIFFNLGFE